MTGMRGDDRQPDSLFSYVSPEQRVPQDHPLRAIRGLVDDVLRDLANKGETFFQLDLRFEGQIVVRRG